MKYDLGQKSPCCSGAMPMPAETDEKVHYPTLYFSGNEKMDIPDEGTAVITFRKVDSGENTRDPDEPMYRCEIEVQSLEVKDGPKKGMVSMADAFKKGLDKSMKKKMEYPEGEE